VDMSEITSHKTIFTIGHSNQSLESFLKLLRDNNIEVLVDVRSIPRSNYATQFDHDSLKHTVIGAGIKYLYLGKEIGGKPANPNFYDIAGYVSYDLIAKSPDFIRGITRLHEGIKKYRVAIMCSEENPIECHRRLLIGKILANQGIEELHIRADGRVQSEQELSSITTDNRNQLKLNLFVREKEEPWKSAKPIQLDSQKGQQKGSSKP
jgi:uncharacterized protein (DUF488 family)